MHDVADGELARAIARSAPGQAAAEEAELVRRFAPRIRLFGLRHLRDEQAAQDLVQEVLVVALTALRDDRIQKPDELASFVLGTCRLSVTNRRRGEQRRTRLLAEFGPDLVPPAAPAVDEPIVAPHRVVECLDRLAPRERTVVVLTFYAERDGDAIARELGTSAGNVRVIRHRALARLRECLEIA
jgi:RNA polymerase sigma-70 factor (ECF subfamily)